MNLAGVTFAIEEMSFIIIQHQVKRHEIKKSSYIF